MKSFYAQKSKKLMALLLSLMFIMVLTACGSEEEETEPEEAAGQTEESEDDGETAETEELEGTLNVVATDEAYVTLFDKFTDETGVTVDMLSMSSGEVLSKVKAEGGEPMADLWFGGGIDAFMEAKEDELLEQITSDITDDLAADFIDEDRYWISKGITVVGFVLNNEIMEEKGLEEPQTWDDLLDPSYEGEILMSNPAISGTNYAVVNALLQVKGEEEGWEYFEELNKNILYYSKRGKDPLTKTSAGEVAIGITYLDRTVDTEAEEQDLTVIYPTDGIPYVPEGVAVFANAPNSENAQAFIDWLYSDDENLALLADIDGKDTVKMVKPDIEGLTLSFDTDTLMEEDLALFGEMRTDILDKFTTLMGDKAEEEDE